MPLDRVRYRRRDDAIEVVGRGEFTLARDDALVLPMAIMRNASLNDLVGALRAAESFSDPAIYFTEAPWEEYDPDLSPRADPQVLLVPKDDQRIEVNVVMYMEDGREPPEAQLRELVEPVLTRHAAGWAGVWTDTDYPPGLVVGVGASLSVRRRSVGQLFDLGQELNALLGAYSGAGELTARSVLDLVRGGRADVLVGQREGPWLDVKAPPYALQTAPQKFELAKDVAAFANTGRDALIVLGLRGARDRNGDVVASPRPFELDDMDVEATRAVLRDLIVPTILDIQVGVIGTRAGYGYGYIFIPAQPTDALPYLVVGALIGGSINGSHISIAYRAGEDTAFADPARIYSLILAGRAALGA